MVLPAAQAILALGIVLQLAAEAPAPPRAAPFDCSWIYHPPSGERRKFEGVYYSFIDNSGFHACTSHEACQDWMGKEATEIAFSDRASMQLRRRSMDRYGIYRIVFVGAPGRLAARPGCDDDPSLESGKEDYVRVEKILSVTRLDGSKP